MIALIPGNGARARRFAAALAVGGLLLAGGCAQNQAARRPRPQAPAPKPEPVKPAEPAPAVPLPETRPTNRVAILVPTTGSAAPVGQSIANAAEMALADVGEKSLTIATYNTAGPGGAAEAARQAVAAGAGIILGPLLASDVRAAAPIAAAEGVPVLSFSNDSSVAGDGVFVLGYQPGDAVDRLVRVARGKGVQSFAALTPAGAYGARVSTAFLRSVEASGAKVSAIATYTRDRKNLLAAARKVTDYDGRLARARGGQPTIRPDGTVVPATARDPGPVSFQALLIADSGAIASSFMPALAQMGAGQVKLLGTELWAAEPGISRLPGLQGAWFAAVPNARFASLAERYRTKFGSTPSRLSSLGYDGVLLIASVADKWPVHAKFPARELRAPGGFKGIDGIFRFGANNVAERGYEVRQVGPGGTTVVAPAPASFAGAVAVAGPAPVELKSAA